jgi:hypothetical protein
MKVIDIVRVARIPSGLPDESQKLFELSLGKSFPIDGIEENGTVQLLAGTLLGMEDFRHTLYFWPHELELVDNSN